MAARTNSSAAVEAASMRVEIRAGAGLTWAGTVDVRCTPGEPEHPWLIRATIPTDTAIALQRAGDEPVRIVAHDREVTGMVAAGRLHQPGPSTIDVFGQGGCPAHLAE